jgi:hypothetical protein
VETTTTTTTTTTTIIITISTIPLSNSVLFCVTPTANNSLRNRG